MQNKVGLIFVVYFWILAAHADSSNTEVIQAWLEKMSHAGHMQNFSGTFVYGKKSDLMVMKIFHRADEFGEVERLISMDGSGKEVIRNNNLVTCVLPEKKSVVVEKSKPVSKFPPSFPTKINELNYYSFSLKQQDNIAGHIAQKIAVIPKDSYRFGYLLWIDVKTGLLLKSLLISEKNEMIEQFMFTNLKYHDKLDDNLFKPSVEGKKYSWFQAKDNSTAKVKAGSFKGWEFVNLPPGYKVNLKRDHTMPRAKSPLMHFVITDGLATVSVYIENHRSENSDLIGGTSMGAVNAYGRHLNEFHVTAVGEAPMVAIKMICDATRLKTNND
ncbi:MAG: MucB/RseB C-terminal domain-containing protein [Gammaproteobacteria bacterium]